MARLFTGRSCFALLLGLAGSFSAHASHNLGGHLSYTSLGNDQYRVRLEAYFDPTSPASAGRTVELVCKKNGCTSTGVGSFVTQLYLQPAAATPPTCSTIAPYMFLVGETTVTLPAAQWTLSVDNQNRQTGVSNISQSDLRDMYLQVFMDNTRGQADSSPRFTELELPYVALHTPHRYSFAAYDADGDSLAYSLVTAKWSPVTSSTGGSTVYPCPIDVGYLGYAAGTTQDIGSSQTAAYPAGQLSATFPLPSFRVSSGTATPWTVLNPTTGLLQLAPAQLGNYAVAVRVDAYRRFNGVPTLISSSTREVTYFTQVSNANVNPTLTATNNGTLVDLDRPLTVLPGQQLNLLFSATDPNAGQTLRLSSNVASQLAGATFQPNLATSTALFSWQVPNAAPSGQYAFTVRATDNACPLNGTETRTVVLQVAGSRPTATVAGQPVQQLPAFPTPFSQQVTFQLTPKVQPVLITDALGRQVARLSSAADGRVSWQPQTLPAGVYFARTLDGRQVVRLVKAD